MITGFGKHAVRFGVVAVALVLVLGCKGKKDDVIVDPNAGNNLPVIESGTDEMPDPITAGQLDWQKWTELRTVYFDYDSYSLRPDALAALSNNAEIIKQSPDMMLEVEGHCDERGTQEYNMALGERRALAVRDHLMKLGVAGDRIITISYGEELPAVTGGGESAWAKNRRCEFNKAPKR